MNLRRTIFNLLAALFLALCTVPVMAQETDTAPVVTVPDATVTLNLWQVIGGVIAAVSVGGIAGFAGAGVLASRLKNDAATIKAIEALADSAPRHVIEALAAIGRSSLSVGELLVEATDGVPAVSKAVASSTVTTDKPVGFASMGDNGGTNLTITATPVSSWKSTSAGHIWTLPEGATLVSGDSEDDTDDPHPTPEKP